MGSDMCSDMGVSHLCLPAISHVFRHVCVSPMPPRLAVSSHLCVSRETDMCVSERQVCDMRQECVNLSKPLRRVMSSNLAGTRESSEMFTESMPPSTRASIYSPTHTHTCLLHHTHMFTAHAWVHLHTHAHVFTAPYTQVYSTSASIYSTSACIYTQKHTFTCVHQTHTHTHTRLHTNIFTRSMRTPAYLCVHSCVCVSVCECGWVCINTYIAGNQWVQFVKTRRKTYGRGCGRTTYLVRA